MTAYSDLSTVLDEIKTLAIDWVMEENGWVKSQGGGYVTPGGYPASVPGPEHGPGAVVSLPQGDTRIQPAPDGTRHGVDYWPLVYKPVIDRVDGLFEAFAKVPDPSGFQHSVQESYDAAKAISRGTADANGARIEANAVLGGLLTSAIGALEDMDGETIKAFRNQYMNRLPDILINQSGAAADLTQLVMAEQFLWAETQKSIMSVADATKAAMAARNPAAPNIVLSVFGIVLGIGSAVATGGWSTVLAIGAGLTNLSANAVTVENAHKKQLALAGSDPAAVLDSASGILDTLKTDIQGEEQKIQDKANTLAGKLGDPTYNLGLPPGFLQEDDETGYVTSGNLLKLQAGHLADISIHYLPDIAKIIRSASTKLTGASDYHAWSREGLGIGSSGPFFSWDVLRDGLIDVLEDSYRACDDAAAQLEIAVKFHGDNDAAVSAELRKHEKEVAEAAAARDRRTMPGPGGRNIPI